MLVRADDPAYPGPRQGSGRSSNMGGSLMRKFALILLAACAALAAPAAAQQPAAPPPPVPYGETINLEQAKLVADAAMAEAKKNNWFMAITVVGPAGDLVYFEKMDNTQYASVTISQQQARAAETSRLA